MAAAHSSSNMPSMRATSLATFPKGRARKVFSSGLFETYVGRIVRKAIAEQFVEDGHQVLSDESRLIGEAESALRDHLERSVPEWNMSWRLCKMVVIQHVRQLAKERLEMHDVDDDTRDEAIESVYRDDFERLFPKSWMDG